MYFSFLPIQEVSFAICIWLIVNIICFLFILSSQKREDKEICSQNKKKHDF